MPLAYTFYEDSLKYDAFGTLFTQPALIFQGKGDALVSWQDVQRFASTRPHVLLTFGPEGAITAHPDHSMASIFATLAYHWAGRTNRFPEQLNNGLRPHRIQKLYYGTAGFTLPERQLENPVLWMAYDEDPEVYLNGKSLYESHLLERVLKPQPFPDSRDHEASTYTWFCESDNQNTYIYANFHDQNPNEQLVEINVRDSCFYPDQPGIAAAMNNLDNSMLESPQKVVPGFVNARYEGKTGIVIDGTEVPRIDWFWDYANFSKFKFEDYSAQLEDFANKTLADAKAELTK